MTNLGFKTFPNFFTIFTITIITTIHPINSLQCYQCEPCNDIGSSVTCPSNKPNCYVAFGYLKNLVGISKGCSDAQPVALGSSFCNGFIQQDLQGYQFSNSTGCLCGTNDCNGPLLPSGYQYVNALNYAVQMAGNLKCYQCNPCSGPGVEVLCADGVVNCFQTVGYLAGVKTLFKGCQDPTATQGPQSPLTCSANTGVAVFNQSLTKAIDCLCSGALCNTRVPTDPDPVLPPSLQCYTCNGSCDGGGVLQTCPISNLNCFVGQGSGVNNTVKGCADLALAPSKYPSQRCSNHTNIMVAGVVYSSIYLCICPTNGCNLKIPTPLPTNLSCYVCDPCESETSGVLTQCPANTVNCGVGQGINASGQMATIKDCGNGSLVSTKVYDKTCFKFDKFERNGQMFSNATVCVCARDGCNNDTVASTYTHTTQGNMTGSGGNGTGGISPPSIALQCYECFDCKDEGALVNCPSTATNCYYAVGYNNTQLVKAKGCAGLEYGLTAPLNPEVCLPMSSFLINGTIFSNVKVCACGNSSCNDQLKANGTRDGGNRGGGNGTGGSSPPSSALQCFECFDCKDEGALVNCPSTATNCYYVEGYNNTQLMKAKGCAGLEYGLTAPLNPEVCLPMSSFFINGTIFSNVKVCACGTSYCNDQLKKKLECYQCETCTDQGQLVSCPQNALNCYVLSGKLGLFDLTSKGCFTDQPLNLRDPVCTRYKKQTFQGRDFKNSIACACPTSKCNALKIPTGSLFTEDGTPRFGMSKMVILVSVLVSLVAIFR